MGVKVGQAPGAAEFVPDGVGIDGLRAAAAGCRGCELYKDATQTVFSKGSPTARVVLVGEQPGDQEDKQGAPFVGPAGQLLNKALAEAGISPADCYVTNAVKHFHFKQTGQRRLHQTPEARHVEACRPWLIAELGVLDPQIVVCLGATAGRALVGPSFRVTKQRGQLIPWPDATAGRAAAAYDDTPPASSRAGQTPPASSRAGQTLRHRSGWLVPTIHPSAVLRADDRDAAYAGLVADLRVVAEALV